MRILWLNWRDVKNPAAGGAEHYIHEVSKRLIKRGHEISVFSSRFRGSRQEEVVDGVTIIRHGDRYSVYYRAKEFVTTRRSNYDVVVECINTIPFFAPVYVRNGLVTLVFQITGEIFKQLLYRPMSAVAQSVEKAVYRIMYSGQTTLCLSNSTKKELMEIGFDSSKVFVAEPGVDYEYLVPSAKYDKPLVLFLNRMIPYKNPDHLIIAFKLVKQKVPDAKLWLVGCRGSRYESKLMSMVRNEGLADCTSFLPFVNGEEKARILSRAWVHVLPSVKEGWGISVLEAASCGTPTVAYKVCGLVDSVKDGETGLLVPFGEISELSNAISSLLTNEELRMKMSKAARQWALHFSWERTAEKVLEAINGATN